jgi:hypothetical protein
MNPKCLVDRPIVRTAHVSIVIDMPEHIIHTRIVMYVQLYADMHALVHAHYFCVRTSKCGLA